MPYQGFFVSREEQFKYILGVSCVMWNIVKTKLKLRISNGKFPRRNTSDQNKDRTVSQPTQNVVLWTPSRNTETPHQNMTYLPLQQNALQELNVT